MKEGAIVDATIIESSRRPGKVVEVMPEDRKEEETETSSEVVYSDDQDANRIKKGRKSYYGYKGHIPVDAKEGFIPGGHITPAGTSDTTELEQIVNESHIPEGSVVFADKGYASEKNRTILAGRNKPLTDAQRMINRFISSIRYKVEQDTGTLKRGYRLFRMRYTGIQKGNMEFLITAMAFNLKKAAIMME